jgi:hypothetical protein
MQEATQWPGSALGVTSVALGAESDQRLCRRLVPLCSVVPRAADISAAIEARLLPTV